MLARTKKPRIDEARFTGKPTVIARLREIARELGATETSGDVTIEEAFPELHSNPHGLSLRGLRYRENLTQAQLAERTAIPQRHISEMEHGKRPIGRETARKLATVLGCDYRVLL
jgi:DNA-binding XRE family transcriptional regulator